ncbi:MAG: hypothetical protein PHG66_00225 [Candidatus Colwellbacteria bacterium]|nr:hypothetical protein [Candidatus Colwellbacteria bacterium]
MTTHHYWISDNKGNILNVYKLVSSGDKKAVRRKIYSRIKSIKTNRTISMSENKVIGEMNIDEIFNVVHVSDKCRILYNDQLTLIEIDGHSSDTALEIFSLIANNEEEFVMFDIDDEIIKM